MAEQHAKLAERLETMSTVDPQELVRSRELGDASFEPGLPVFERTVDMFEQLRATNYDLLPDALAQAASDRADQTINVLRTIRDFDLNQENVIKARDDLVQEMERQYTQTFKALAPTIAYLTGVEGPDSQRREADEMLSKLNEAVEQSYKASKDAEDEIERALQSVRKATAEAGVGQQSLVFDQEARRNGTQAVVWLVAATVFAVAAFVYAWRALTTISGDPSTSELLRLALQRTLLFSILAFAMGFSARQYRASRHNQTVNRHREAALRTFETFVQATPDTQVRNAVLLEATRSIFSAQPTGFLGRAGADSPSPLVEVIQKAASAVGD